MSEVGELIYKDREEIAVVYYRSGYSPEQYKDDQDWEARRILEVSKAIKCPSVNLQLLTFKKIQEVLAREETWTLLFRDNFSSIKHLFIDQMWGLDDLSDPETLNIINEAIENPDLFVLKTQREGGGNNYFGQDIKVILQKGEELKQFSLMRKIKPIEFEGLFLTKNKVFKSN